MGSFYQKKKNIFHSGIQFLRRQVSDWLCSLQMIYIERLIISAWNLNHLSHRQLSRSCIYISHPNPCIALLHIQFQSHCHDLVMDSNDQVLSPCHPPIFWVSVSIISMKDDHQHTPLLRILFVWIITQRQRKEYLRHSWPCQRISPDAQWSRKQHAFNFMVWVIVLYLRVHELKNCILFEQRASLIHPM